MLYLLNCYFYGPYAKRYGQNTIEKTDKFDWPIRKKVNGEYRLPLFLSYPIKRRFIACAPLLDPIDLTPYLNGVNHVTVGGETGRDARICDYDWILNIREQCIKANVTFWFKNTGSLFRHDGVVEKINPFKQTGRAKELGIDTLNGKKLF